MKLSRFSAVAIAAATITFAGSAMAVPISVGFNFIGFGTTFTGNGAGGDISTSTTVSATGGLGYVINGIDLVSTTNNIGAVLGGSVFLTDPMPLTLGGVFTKTFTTSFGTFTESLTVDTLTIGASSRAITASGTISGGGFDPTTVYFSASYTQNGGPTGQINASFNNSTVPPPPVNLPEPSGLALVGLALAGLALSRKRKQA